MIIPEEEKKSKFRKILGLSFFSRSKDKKEPETPVSEVEEKPVTEEVEGEKETEESPEEIIEKEEAAKLEKEEKEKKKKKEELKKKYGVTKEIPKRKVEKERIKTKKIEEKGEEVKLHDLVLRLEKISGKMEILDRSRNDTNERMTHLAEEIGELRTMIMERERSFDKIETDFEKVKDTVSDLEPMKIKKDFEKREMEILKNQVKIEKIESLVKALGEENKKFRKLMEKIKSFENLIDISYDIDRKVSEIKKVKDYADKVASKVESIFSELNTKVSELEDQREKVERLDELTIEMTKMLDDISVKLTKFVSEKDLKDFKKSMEEDLKKMIKFPTAERPTVKVEGDQQVQVKLSELSSRISKLKSVVESQNAIITNIIERMEGKPVSKME